MKKGFSLTSRQRLRRRKGAFASDSYSMAVAYSVVALTGSPLRLLLRPPFRLARGHPGLAILPAIRVTLCLGFARLEEILMHVQTEPGLQDLLGFGADGDDPVLSAPGALVCAMQSLTTRPLQPHWTRSVQIDGSHDGNLVPPHSTLQLTL